MVQGTAQRTLTTGSREGTPGHLESPGTNRARHAFDAPWTISSEIRRLAGWPLSRIAFAAAGIKWRRRWRIYGRPIIQRHAGSTIEIGDGLSLRSFPASNPLAPNHPVVLATRSQGARISIGSDFGMTGGTICAAERIEIGDRVLVGANSAIVDTDFHPTDHVLRTSDPQAGAHSPVQIANDVFIGMNALIVKGVSIGERSVVGAGAVVVEDVPADAIVAGNPARVVKRL